MTKNEPPDDRDQSVFDMSFKDPDKSNPIVVYPLVADRGNRRVLKKWLADQSPYQVADTSKSLSEAQFDLCVVDGAGLEEHKADLESVKNDAAPVLLPVLLLLSERRSDVINADGGAIADNVFATTVDEILSMPIRQTELNWRIQSLLRQREQSQELQTRANKLNRFRQAVDASGHAIFITDTDGTIEYVNPTFEAVTGYTADEAVGKDPSILNSEEMPPDHFDQVRSRIRSGDVWEGEIINRRKEGDIYTAHQTVAPITGGDDDIDAFVAIQMDITERKELQDQLKLHRDIVQRLEDPIMLQDREGNFQLVNEAVADFAGRSRDELHGEDESLFMNEATAVTIDQRKKEVVETETQMQYTISPDFEETGIDATFSTKRYPWYNEDDELTGTIAICRDVTDLENRTRQLKVIDHVFRHNLRNSLTVIQGFADNIRSQSSGETADAAEAILASVDELLTTSTKSRAITNVLSEAPDRTTLDIKMTIESVIEPMRTVYPDADIEVSVPSDVCVKATTYIDDVIEELVTNAIDHHDQDEPSVTLRVTANTDTVEIDVIDDGPGIDPMNQDVLETGRAIDDMHHGSGLGLWLVYWIVSRSDGSIDVEDVNPKGTRITICLPRQTGAKTTEAREHR